MGNLVLIGRFAQITRLTIKALRLYDAQGLLQPALVDDESGYRYYHLAQTPLARRIRLLRSLDMPLDEIRAVVQAADSTLAQQILRNHQERIAARIAKDQSALRILECIIADQEELMAYAVKVKQLAVQPVVSIRRRITLADNPQLIPALIDELNRYAARLSVRHPDYPPMIIWHECNEEADDIEVGVPIVHAVAAAGHITSRIIPGGPVASAMHIGPYDEISAVYPAIAAWMQEHGHELNGPPREVYWTDPAKQDPAEYRTEVLWPIQ